MALALTFPPSGVGWLAPLPLALLFRTVVLHPPRHAFSFTLAFGAAFFGVHLLWLPTGLAPLLGPGVFALQGVLVALLALMWAVTVALTRRVMGGRTLWALPFAWTLLDTLRALGPFGFTWGSLGYAFAPTPLVQVADLGGIALVGLLVALTAGVIAAGRPRPLLCGAALLALAGTYGLTRPAVPEGDLRALLVQGRVDPRAKVRGRTTDELRLYTGLTRAGLAGGRVDLAVWPETASPAAPTTPGVAAALRALGVPLLLGAPTREGPGVYNSVYAFEGGRTTGRQDKVRLVPFGESFPGRVALGGLYQGLFRALGLPPLTGTLPGERVAPLRVGGVTAGPLICYESTFPALARAQVRRGADVLVTVSNDAWFGPSAGAEQHFLMGRVQAIETRRWLLRAGNDGVSAVVDASGRVRARFPRGARAAFGVDFAVARTFTPYVRFGEWVALLSVLVLLGLWAWRGGGRDGEGWLDDPRGEGA